MQDRIDNGIVCKVCGARSSVAFYVSSDGGYLCETHHAEIDTEAPREIIVGGLYSLVFNVASIVKVTAIDSDGVATIAHNATLCERIPVRLIGAPQAPDCARCGVPLFPDDDENGILWDVNRAAWAHASCAAQVTIKAQPHWLIGDSLPTYDDVCRDRAYDEGAGAGPTASEAAALREMLASDARESAEIDTTTDDDESDCPECGYVNAPLGILGTTVHYRCRACGAEYYRRAQAPEAPDVATRINRACGTLNRVRANLRVISWAKDEARPHPLGTLGYYSPSLEDALSDLEGLTHSVRVLYDELRDYRAQLANEPCAAPDGFACADCVNSGYCDDSAKRAHSAHSYRKGIS